MHYQKVVFLFADINVGAIEIRHDSEAHYKQVIFSLDKKPIFDLLTSKIEKYEQWGSRVVVYGKAIKKFEKKHKEFLNQ